MSIKTFIFTCCAAVMVATADAKRPVKIVSPSSSAQDNQQTHQLMNQQVSELMADRVGFKKDMTDKLIEMEELEELEAFGDLQFRADKR